MRRLPPPLVGAGAQVAVLGAVALVSGLGAAGWVAGAAYTLAGYWLLTRGLRRPRGGGGWGPADTVTLTRALLVGAVTALVADSLTRTVSVTVLVTLAAVALFLDGVDGQVARRTGTVTAFGARFDMETDSLLVLVLAVYAATVWGWWILAIGSFRYAFGIACRLLPWLREPLPPRLSRKAVAVLQGVALVVVSAEALPAVTVPALLTAVLALLIWSFGRDVGHLWRRRNGTRQHTVDVTRVGLVRQRGQVLRHFLLGNPTVEGQPVRLTQRHIEPVRAQ